MKDNSEEKNEKIMRSELTDDEMENVSGGESGGYWTCFNCKQKFPQSKMFEHMFSCQSKKDSNGF